MQKQGLEGSEERLHTPLVDCREPADEESKRDE